MRKEQLNKFGDDATTFDGIRKDPHKITIAEDAPDHPHFDRHTVRRKISRWLVESIKKKGVLAPVMIYVDGDTCTAADGRRRIRHARVASDELVAEGKKPLVIRCIPVNDPADARRIANRFRMSESPMAEAHDLADIMAATGATEYDDAAVNEAAAELGVTKKRARTLLLLLKLTPELQAKVDAKEIPVDVALRLGKRPQAVQRATVADLDATEATGPEARAKAHEVVAPKYRMMSGKKVEALAAHLPNDPMISELVGVLLGKVRPEDVKQSWLKEALALAFPPKAKGDAAETSEEASDGAKADDEAA